MAHKIDSVLTLSNRQYSNNSFASHDDLATLAHFQQGLISPRLQQALLDQAFARHHGNIGNASITFALQQQQQQQQQQQEEQLLLQHLQQQVISSSQQNHLPSHMVPPQSPTLSSYYFENNNGWVNHYHDPKRRQFLSSKVDPSEYYFQQGEPTFHQPHQHYNQTYHNDSNHSNRLFSTLSEHIQHQPQPIINATNNNTLFSTPNACLAAATQVAIQAAAHAATASTAISTGTNTANTNSNLSIPTSLLMHRTSETELQESLLQFAHSIYSSCSSNSNSTTLFVQNPYLIPLLHILHEYNPSHLPTLLLLACVYYSYKDYESSLRYNQLILKYEPNYVEAMSNIGTTLRSLGKTAEAEKWWYQAVRLRPGYWDAVENLVGVLCATTTASSGSTTAVATEQLDNTIDSSSSLRYTEALQVCEFVEKFFFPSAKKQFTAGSTKIPKQLPAHQLSRLQNLFYAKGNLKYALGDVYGAQCEYEKGLELAFGGQSLLSICHLLVRLCNQTGLSSSTALDIKNNTSSGMPSLVLLQPDQAVQVLHILFSASGGLLPGLIDLSNSNGASASDTNTSAIQQTHQITGTLLLTLAKLFQDVMNPTTPSLVMAAAAVSSGGHEKCQPTLSTLLPLYYLSLALQPSPSTANNLGIILSGINSTVVNNAVKVPSATPQPQQPLTGTLLAMQYYMYGLQLDPQHSHLYTNLGSLLKDMGHLNEAVQMYEKAVEFNPRFDVALANLGNAIKDLGRVQDSVQWYRRAVEVNPDFVDAVCGLVNSLSGVCDWRGRGSVGFEAAVDQFGNYFEANAAHANVRNGWIGRVVEIVDKQLDEGSMWGAGCLKTVMANESSKTVGEVLVRRLLACANASMIDEWRQRLAFYDSAHSEKKDEGGWLIRLIERILRRLQRNWYIETYGSTTFKTSAAQRIIVNTSTASKYKRPILPETLPVPPVPTVLPFHTFTYPLTARQIRLISHRNALRISHNALTSTWLPDHVYPPPPPPSPHIKLGYVSSDFNNHPLSHLMQSVFGFHNTSKFEVFCYATTPSDNSPYRLKIERETQHFLDVSTWSNQQVVEKIIQDGIHVLVNLNGYTKGARNEIFAARPCPVQCSFMGFAGTLGGGWCDWIIADPVVCPPDMVSGEVWRSRQQRHSAVKRKEKEQDTTLAIATKRNGDFEGDLDPEQATDDFVYTEKFIYMPHSYFVNDHKQGFRDEHVDPHSASSPAAMPPSSSYSWAMEQEKRWQMRHQVFPQLPDNVVIFANFNQLYKLEPSTFKLWLRILERVPNSILWLLRFPPAGEQHLKRCALQWAGPSIAQRVVFTDIAPKHVHIHRGRVADVFLDTPECNAHTTAADILWSGTPMVTYPKYRHKMCSRVGASIAMATGYGQDMVVLNEQEYENKAIEWATSLNRQDGGCLMALRKKLFLTREKSRLFDTLRWTQNLERGYEEAWRRWVTGEEFEDVTPSAQDRSGCIWVVDPDDEPSHASTATL